MTHEYTQLVIFTPDCAQASVLTERFRQSKNILIECGDGRDVSKRLCLDALWITPMQASYFGVSKPLPFGKAIVLPMPTEKAAKGLPRLIIVGVSLVSGRDYTPQFRARIPAEALAAAVSDYNKRHAKPILRVGSIPENLGLDSPNATDASHALRIGFADLRTQPEAKSLRQLQQRA